MRKLIWAIILFFSLCSAVDAGKYKFDREPCKWMYVEISKLTSLKDKGWKEFDQLRKVSKEDLAHKVILYQWIALIYSDEMSHIPTQQIAKDVYSECYYTLKKPERKPFPNW